MNFFELLGINNTDTFLPIFLIVLVIEVILVILAFWIIRGMKQRKRERELRRKRKQRLKEIQAAKARREAETAARRRAEEQLKAAAQVKTAPQAKAAAQTEAAVQAEAQKTEAKAVAQREAGKHEIKERQDIKRTEEKEKKLYEEKKEEPVISVQHVTMVFKVATSNVSGLKEYVIQKVEKKISHRELKALNDVSFDVYKGEVVGIIGTNGSGKSTILRIVSGALRPTSGRVVVDKKKVQLLTLGTGFDYELTAKENVYLNGSIIGYSKEFIDRHYNEIVEFAELQDFMEEKVKNFSSGMVSRLGFAIATAGGAAEILILDEVLSVGDEFFRKKSLAKIQEMIHGGSTVLLVSHNMNTIRQNCSKVVWIEKGDLRMIGTPKEVCAAYSKLNG